MANYPTGVLLSDNPDTTRTGKYFVYRTHDNPAHRTDPNDPKAFAMFLNKDCIEGGFYFGGGLTLPKEPMTPEEIEEMRASAPHFHMDVEYLGFLGTNPDDRTDLGAEIEFHLDGEPHTITRSCVVMIPAQMPHCPLIMKRVDKPFVLFGASSVGEMHNYVKIDQKDKLPKQFRTGKVIYVE